MWLLSCDGDLWGGKRLWLRPGTEHLLGRTSGHPENGERIRYIEPKSVSRKHLLITVSPVTAEDSGLVQKRTTITLKDNSKVGTTLNGEKFSQGTKTLDGKEYTFKLGTYEHLFRLVWRPIVFSFPGLGGKKSRADALSRLERTDFKLTTDYISNTTTHVIAKKRNVPAVLQALVQGRWVVNPGFIDALAEVTKREGADANGDANPAPLEDDFDAFWPSEDSEITPPGGETVQRPNEYMKPRPERAEVFKDFVFVFLSQEQYDTLMPVVTSGGGKALVWNVHINESSVEDLVEYVKEVAGKKGDNHFRLSQQDGAGGVVVVRLRAREDEWSVTFLRGIDRALDQRSIEQSEFLDTILTLDTSGLRSPLLESQASEQRQSQPAPQEQVINIRDDAPEGPQTQLQSEQQEVQAEQSVAQAGTGVKRRNRRLITKSRFKDYDDWDASQYIRPVSKSPEPSAPSVHEPSQAASAQDMEVDEPSQGAPTQQSTRKRPLPVEEEAEEEGDMYESMLQGQAALKRRKTEAANKGGNASFAKSSVEAESEAAQKAAGKTKKQAKHIDVKAELLARREKEAEQQRQDEENLRQQMEGVDIAELKNLAKVEEMELPVRDALPPRSNENGRSERWDPAWNGRKNFKKFRPQGRRRDGPRLQRLIVPLEEAPRKSDGIGDEYWLTSTSASSKGKSKSQSQSQTVRAGPSAETANDLRRQLQRSREEDAQIAVDDSIDPADIAGRARDETIVAQMSSDPSQTLGTASQRKAAGKRPAAQQGGGPAKKARQSRLATTTTTVDLDNDDDDDGLKFKRRRR